MNSVKKILIASLCFSFTISFAQRGKEGNVTINTANRIVNEYTTLTANASAGATTISVTASSLNANSRFSGPLAAGDLIMIIQMQGISGNGSVVEFPAGSGTFYGIPNDKTWGEITNYNNCGNYEFCEVNSVPNSGSITLDCGLTHDYTSSGRVQVIRVPRYNTLTITAPGTLTGQTWANGGIYTGGVVAVEVLGNTVINNAGGITASAIGFRGGSTVGDNLSALGGGQVGMQGASEGSEKGEGVFGYQSDYNLIGGRYCRGVAGNAGGGGNCHNAGGGGGSNAGNITGWDGEGNPDISGGAGWVSAWNLEVTPSFSTHTSSGGGRGGYSFASANRNATLEGPKPFQSGGTNLWNGDYRINNGGWGGRPLDYSTGRLFLGGGGGAGDQDNGCAGTGGKGGGLIYLMSYGTVGGTGTVLANGAVGGTTISSGFSFGIDGAGGAGGGGTVIINSVGAISGISISADGGVGGNQNVGFTETQSEGPGGGGGGGYIALSNGVITQTANGGANGTTNCASLSEFPPNGATRGGAGLTGQLITNFIINASDITICSGNTGSLTATLSGTIPPGTTINWYSTQTGGVPIGTGSPFVTPVLTTSTTYYVGTCPGTYRIPVIVTVTPGPSITVNSAAICSGQTVSLTALGGTTYTWSVGATSTGVNTADASPAITTSYTVTGTTAGCSGTAVSTVTVTSTPTITVNSPVICLGQTAGLIANGGTTYTWSSGAVSTGTNTANASPASSTTYTVTGTTSGCSATAISSVTVNSVPVITVNSPAICSGQTANLIANGGVSYTWSAGAASTGINTADASPVSTTSYTVTGTTSGCSATAVSTVTVTTSPTITVNSPTICEGDTASLTASGGTTYVWSAGATSTGTNTASASPSSTASYTVTGTASGCSTTAVSTVTVTPLPNITVNSPSICPGQTAILIASGGTTYTWSAGAVSTGVDQAEATPSSTTTYTVTGTTGSCSDTAMATVTVGAGLIVTVNSPTICAGDTANLIANGGTTYSWSAGASSTGVNTADASPSVTTSYTVTGTTAGCTGTAVSTVTVTSLPIITVNSPVICAGTTASLTASGGTTYSWSSGVTSTGVNTGDASPAITTSYTVTGTSGSCSNTAIATVTVDSVLLVTVNSPTICEGLTAGLTANGGSSYVWSAGATSTGINTADASPVITTNYTVTATSGTCSGSATSTVTVIPAPNITVNSLTICSGDTAVLFANGGTTYSWSSGTIPIGTDSVQVSPGSTATYTVTGTASGCSDSAIATVNVNANPVVTVNDTTICSGLMFVLNASGASTYSWSAGATPISPGSSTANAFPSVTTSYTVTGTTAGCSGTAVSTATIAPGPLVTVNSPTICLGETAILTASGANTYTWTPGATSSGINTATASPSVTTTYTVAGTDSTGCSGTASSTVTIDFGPVLTINIPPAICAGDTATLIAGGATIYTWSFGADSTGVNTAAASPDSTTIYTVTGTAGGCPGTISTTVTVNQPLSISVNSPSICIGDSAILTASGAAGYIWSFGADSSNVNTAVAGPLTTTSYIVTETTSGCSGTAVSIVTVNSIPVISVNSPTICSGSVATLIANGGTSYSWSSGASGTGTNTATVSPTGPSSYTVTGTTNGCSSTAVSIVSVNDLPIPSFTSNLTNGCAPLCVQFIEAASPNCNNLLFDFGDGNTSSLSSPQHCFVQAGPYSVSVSCTDAYGCIGVTTIPSMITVADVPEADFSISPSAPVLTNSQVVFTDISSFGGTQLWNFGDVASGVNNTSAISTASHVYAADGNYCITLISANSAGCKDTTSECIDVISESTISIPNIFTPNGDNVNDLFIISTTAITELTCSIYDRWGLKLAEWNGVNGYWDGKTSSGNSAPDGVYFYVLKAEGIERSGKKITIEKQGFVQLLQKN